MSISDPIDATSTVRPPPRVDWVDGGVRMPAPEPEPERVETGWDRGGAFGTWRTWAGGFASWHRHDAPAESEEEDDRDPWSWVVFRALGLSVLGVPLGAWRALSWISDARGAAAERELHRTVPRAAIGYHLGQHDHHHLGAVLAHHRAEREMHIRRVWWRCIVSAVLGGGAGASWVWLPQLLGPVWTVTLIGALACGALAGAHRVGADWLAERAGGAEWDGEAPGQPAPLNMPTAPRDEPRAFRAPTDTELLLAVRGVFLGEAKLPTAEIVARLRNGGGWWATISTRLLGMRLSDCGLKSCDTNAQNEHGVNPKGWRLADITSALAARTHDDHRE